MLSARFLFLLLPVASAFCPAQTATPPTAEFTASLQDATAAEANKPRPLPRGHITGHVVCNDTRLPARGAVVMLQPLPSKDKGEQNEARVGGGMHSTRVGLDGTYELEHVAKGDYVVLAFYPGYLSPVDDMTIAQNDSNMEAMMMERLAGQGVVHIGADSMEMRDVTLERGATISGRVLYTDGSPASQVNIELESTTEQKKGKPGEMTMNLGAMMRSMFTHQTNATDDQGHFRLSGLKAGTYRVAAVDPFTLGDDATVGGDFMAAGMGILGGMSNPSSRRVFAGDTVHRKAAKTYELRAGDTLTDLDIRLPIDGFHPVRMRLAATDGRPITHATIILQDASDDTLTFAASNHSDGTYEARDVPPGTYTIKVTAATIALNLYSPPTAAFADGSSSVIVKDTEGSEIAISLKEVPLPRPGAEQEDTPAVALPGPR